MKKVVIFNYNYFHLRGEDKSEVYLLRSIKQILKQSERNYI
jgi:hypothetical protein